MTGIVENSSWQEKLEDSGRRVLVFPLAASDASLSQNIERALEAGHAHFFGTNERLHVFLMSGWLPQCTGAQYERIRAFGESLRGAPGLALWVLTAEKSAEDIRLYAPGPLYITGKLLSAGIPIFNPDMGASGVEESMQKMTDDCVLAWIDLLATIAPGPINLSHWRHDIRGRILGTINLNLQMNDNDLASILFSVKTPMTIGLWTDLVQTHPYCEEQPKVTEAAKALLDTLAAIYTNASGNLVETRKRLAFAARELEQALDTARKISTGE